MINNKIVAIVVAGVLVCAECGEAIEGRLTKDHTHSEHPYKPTTERGFNMIVFGTSASTAAVSGDG